MVKSKKNKIKIITLIVLPLAILITIVSSVYAAYYGRGIFKDVFVNRKYIFASDYLVETNDINKASENKIYTVNNVVNVHVYNYDVSSGDFDNFDISFDVYAWLSNTNKSIKVEVNKEEVIVNSTEVALIKEGVTLQKDIQDSKIISIKFDSTDATNLSSIPSVNIAVKATSPSFLNTKVLCANFTITQSDEFHIDSYLDYKEEENTYDYAAFKYYIVVNGEPSSNTVTLNYNSSYLSVSSWSINSEVIKTSEGVLTITISKDEMIEIVFIRTANSFWDDELTFENGWSKIENLISLVQ